jgi:hypothetical protein
MGWESYDDEDVVTPKSERPRCGARTRVNTPCRALAIWDRQLDRPRNGRCRMHGGLSTGPKTAEGRRRSLGALQKGHAAWLMKK